MSNVLGTLFLLTAVAAATPPIDLSKTTNAVEFLAVGQPSALKIRGKVPDGKMTGTCRRESSDLVCVGTLPLDAFDTGIEMRNQHMKEKYLETAKFPDATVTAKVPVAADGTYGSTFAGTMKLHGVEKPVAGKAQIDSSGGKLGGVFEFDFQLADYGVAVPSYLGVTVSKAVAVMVRFRE